MAERDHIDINKIDSLIRRGRVPLVISGTQLVDRNPIFAESSENVTLVFIPPYRSKFGDSVMGNPDTEMEFFSPEGKSRGKASWKIFDGDAQTLRENINKALLESFPKLREEHHSLYIQIPHPVFG